MIPNTNLHKICGFLAGLATSYALKKFNLVLDPEALTATFLGVSLFVGSVIAKYTNPTGANKSEHRQILEEVVEETKATGERKLP